MARRSHVLGSLAALVALAACGDNFVDTFAGLVAVSGTSPFANGCNGGHQTGENFPNAQVEPSIAIDANNPLHMVATWQQGRWTDAGANGNLTAVSSDGGATWTLGEPAFGACAGGKWERTSDPWATITPDGSIYASALAFDVDTARSAVLASTTIDGTTWETPAVLIDDDDPDVVNDKESVSSDAMHVYVIWDRLTGLTQPTQPVGSGPAYLARLTAGAWEPARSIFDPGIDNQTIGNVISVLPDGALVDVADVYMHISSKSSTGTIVAIRSTDHGDTWSAPVTIAPVDGIGVADPRGVPIRSGTGDPSVAVDLTSGALYATWENLAGDHDGIALARSLDGGLTWTAPVELNGAPDVPAFEPSVAVAGDGVVGVMYYDLRGTTSSEFAATPWLATSVDRGRTWSEAPLSLPFALAPAKLGSNYFLGDYQGLASGDDGFVPLFAVAQSAAAPTEVMARPLP